MMKNFDPEQVVVIFKGVLFQGFKDGTFVSAEREEDAFTKEVGAQGDVVRVKNANRSGSVTVTLQAESPTNDSLSAFALSDELFGLEYGPLMIKNLNGTTLVQAEEAWIRKMPVVGYGDAGESREWVFDCAVLRMLVGGALI